MPNVTVERVSPTEVRYLGDGWEPGNVQSTIGRYTTARADGRFEMTVRSALPPMMAVSFSQGGMTVIAESTPA